MGADLAGRIRYRIFDPTGNITALVEGTVAVDRQPAVAARIMRAHPEVEQVGFVREASGEPEDDGVQACLRMAGGEFCGNATMSAAAWHLLQSEGGPTVEGAEQVVWMRVSGASRPVEVRLARLEPDVFDAAVRMPQALGVDEVELVWGGYSGEVPVVRMEGISHVVIEPSSELFGLLSEQELAGQAVRAWCAELGADGLGLMFWKHGERTDTLTPLVFVPGGDTVFWENSCASGSSAVAMYAAQRCGEAVSLTLAEPGGTLRAESDPECGATWLKGTVRQVGAYEL